MLAAVATNQPDYAPGDTAHIFASSFQPGEAVQFQVLHNDGTPNTGNGHLPWNVVDGSVDDLDGQLNGDVETTWYVDPDDSNLSSFNLTATGLDSHLTATTTFTDVGSTLSQFSNLPTTNYQTGSLNGVNSAYVEGNSVPFRYLVSDLREGAAVVLDIIYQFQSSAAGARTYDYLTNDTASQAITDTDRFGISNASKPSGFGLTTSSNLVTTAIPDDPSISTDTGGSFRVASNVSVSVVSVSVPAISSSPDEKHIIMVIQLGNDGDATPNENIVDLGVFWGGHLARDTDYAGDNNGASDAPGASFHMRAEGFQDLNGNGVKNSGEANLGGGDRSMQTGAVVHTSLAWEKRRADTNALQGGATFTVTANPFTGAGSLVIADDTDGVTSPGDIDHDPDPGQFLLEDILFGTYTITETAAPAGFLIDADATRVQSVTAAAPTAVVGTQGVNNAGTSNESDFHNTAFTPAINVEKFVNGQDADSPTGPILAVGSTATFTYQVTNTGNVPLSSVVVVDDNGTPGIPGDNFSPTFTGGDTNNNSKLDLSETWTYTANHTVTAGQYTNIGKVTGQSSIGQMVMDTDPANHFGAAPAIGINKVTVDAPASGDELTILSGESISWQYTVTNTGNVALSGVVVTDNQAGVMPIYQSGDINNNSLLDLTETWIYTAAGTTIIGNYSNTGTAKGSFTDSAQQTSTVMASDQSLYFGANPLIALNKVTVDGANIGDGITINAGNAISWRYTVTNTGNVALSGVTVTDNQLGVTPIYQSGDVNNDSTLDLSETWIYTAAGIAINGNYSNLGTANGSFTDTAGHSRTAMATDPSSYIGECEIIVIGPDKQNTSTSLVKIVDKKTGQVLTEFFAYEPNFQGGVRLATGDMDGDGVDEIITVPGRGRAPEIRVFKQDGTELMQFRTMAYATTFAGGVEVAVGDVNGDGKNDIVTTPTYGPTQVRVFFNDYPAADPIHDSPDKQFNVFSNKFQGGADVILVDVGTFANGVTVDATTPDGKSEIVVGNGPGMRSTIFVYDVTGAPTVVDTILPFSKSFKGGITLDAARINADAIPDFIVAAGNGGKSAIEIWSGLTNDGPDVRLSAFNAFTGAKTVNAPVHATAMDTNGDGIADTIVAVQGTDGATSEIRSFSPSGVLQSKLTGFKGSWNIARLRCHEPMAAAFDQVFANLGA